MPKILIVDDDVQATALIADVLSLHGHEATTLNVSAKTLEVANTVKPDIFVLDLMMPPPDGFKLCRMLRADPNFRHTPILIVTALDATDSKIVALGAGASDYLAKPFQVDELAMKVQALLQKKASNAGKPNP